jgi:RNA polymerase sigma factor (sigma-70 family)
MDVIPDPTHWSDEALVLACRRGDQSAWAALVQRFQRLIYAIPLRAGLDEDLAAEVFQRTFMRLLEQLHNLEQPDRVQAWLVTTAKRESWRQARRQRAEVSLVDSADVEANPLAVEVRDEAPLPDEVIAELEDQSRLRRAVEALEERCRRLLLLLFYRPEPLPYTEVAAALGIPEGSLGPTRARCLNKVRQWLERQ